MPKNENNNNDHMKDLLNYSFLDVLCCGIPCAASSTTRTRVPQFKVSATPFLPALYQQKRTLLMEIFFCF